MTCGGMVSTAIPPTPPYTTCASWREREKEGEDGKNMEENSTIFKIPLSFLMSNGLAGPLHNSLGDLKRLQNLYAFHLSRSDELKEKQHGERKREKERKR